MYGNGMWVHVSSIGIHRQFIGLFHGFEWWPSPPWSNQCRDRSIAPRNPGYFEHSLSIHGRSLLLSAYVATTEVPGAARSWPPAAWPAASDARGRSHGGSASCARWPRQVRGPRPYWLRPWAPKSCHPACPSYLAKSESHPQVENHLEDYCYIILYRYVVYTYVYILSMCNM